MKLVVHIGNGKTGTTSIQQTLDAARGDLQKRGIHYLGRMLEHGVSETVKDWQTPAGAETLLHNMPAPEVESDLREVLTAELSALETREATTAIWSNEALFARHMGVIEALQALRADGVDVQIVLYLRRHDKWARSAYAQWGIRHKSYQGPIKPFADWIAERPARFGPNLEVWHAAFGEALIVRNFDATGDVALDFLSLLDIDNIAAHRVYETPTPEELTLHAAFNDRFPGVVLPDRFQRFSQSVGDLSPKTADPARIGHLLPSQGDLDKVLEDSAEDLARINAILIEKGQPPFDSDAEAKKTTQPELWGIIDSLLKINFSAHERLVALEKRVAELES